MCYHPLSIALLPWLQVLEEFNKREADIKRLTIESKKCSEELAAHRQEIAVIKTQWIEPLQELLSQINDNFGRFFQSMNCAGEVDLNIPDNAVSILGIWR